MFSLVMVVFSRQYRCLNLVFSCRCVGFSFCDVVYVGYVCGCEVVCRSVLFSNVCGGFLCRCVVVGCCGFIIMLICFGVSVCICQLWGYGGCVSSRMVFSVCWLVVKLLFCVDQCSGSLGRVVCSVCSCGIIQCVRMLLLQLSISGFGCCL